MHADDVAVMRAQGWAALWGAAIAVALLVPALFAMGSSRGALIVVGSLCLVGIWRGMRIPNNPPPPPWALALGAAVPIAIVSHVFAPLVAAPVIAGLCGVSLAANPFLERRRSVIFLAVVMISGIVMPAIVEQLGWLSPSMEVQAGELVLQLAAPVHTWMLVPLCALLAIGVVTSAIALGRFTRRQERSLRRQLHVQAWQVRQLVIDPA